MHNVCIILVNILSYDILFVLYFSFFKTFINSQIPNIKTSLLKLKMQMMMLPDFRDCLFPFAHYLKAFRDNLDWTLEIVFKLSSGTR